MLLLTTSLSSPALGEISQQINRHHLIYINTHIPIHIWLSPFVVHLKLSQHCESSIPPYKIKSLKNKNYHLLPIILLEHHCPLKPSVTMEAFYISAVPTGSHQSHAANALLKCGQCNPEIELYLHSFK